MHKETMNEYPEKWKENQKSKMFITHTATEKEMRSEGACSKGCQIVLKTKTLQILICNLYLAIIKSQVFYQKNSIC